MTQLRVVVGSGPNAVAVTHALLQRGFPVTIFDVGETLDPETAEIVRTMSRQEPDEWSREHKAIIRQVDFNADPGLAPKRAFGSSFAYFLDPARSLSARGATVFAIPGIMPSLRALHPSRHRGLSHLSVDLRAPPFEENPAHLQLYFDNLVLSDGLRHRSALARGDNQASTRAGEVISSQSPASS